MSDILDSLNDEQKLAAKHIDDALLILAGAGRTFRGAAGAVTALSSSSEPPNFS